MVAENKYRLTTKYFYYRWCVITHCEISVFATPVTSCYICKQDLLLTDLFFTGHHWFDQ